MGFYVRNSTPNPIYVAVGYYDSDCSPITYAKSGWYRITPGRRSLIVTGSAANRSFYVYGHDSFGNEWSGNFYSYVPSTAFTMCWIESCQGAGCRRVGFDKVDVGNFENHTLNLVDSTQGASNSRNTRVSKKRTPKFKLGKFSIKKSPGKLSKLGKDRKPLYGKRK
ncbi:Uncharacterized membrane protein [Paenibacillus uliginis N3/975]|uniref:Uncharacterized membrane protein n=1 Tax=Paenibacillus uliginis N3/975 TaxID=1313296 RepID=A0A1X7HEN0_9BACL|nr:DUF1036 domain-containing protein [Paenibacillus uliginis]SMF85194.1 Uncharacterized membrane protein [Paenibacillus uliginis N3/975]